MATDYGAPASGTGSRPSDQAPAGLAASRVDPSRWRHVVRGTSYEVIGMASLQNAYGASLSEGDCLIIYRDDEGCLWAREASEFRDGRFEPLSSIPITGGENG